MVTDHDGIRSLVDFSLRVVQRIPALLFSGVNLAFSVIALIAVLLIIFSRPLGEDVLDFDFGVSPLFSLIPLGILLVYGILRGSYDIHLEELSRAHSGGSVEIRYSRKPPYNEEGRRHRLGVKNTSISQLSHTRLHLVNIEPDPGLKRPVLPVSLGRRRGGTDNVFLNPGDEDYFDVLRVVRSGGSNLIVWAITTEAGDIEVDLAPNDDYLFNLSATANIVSPTECTIRVRKNSSGQVSIWPVAGVKGDGFG